MTNTHAPGKTSIAVTKAWDDKNNQDGKRPESVTVHLLADGQDTGKSVILNEANNWSDSFTDLAEKKAGAAIAYTVAEDKVAGYDVTITGDAKTGYTVTNTHTPETTSVSGTKTWDDNDNQDGKRSESITIRLLANGKEVTSKEVSAADKWAWSFDNLPKYESGKEIRYSVAEDEVDGYKSEVSGFDITNTHTPETVSVSGNKVWIDNDNQDGVRPESVTIRLLANGEEVTSKKVTADDEWAWTFDNLPKYENGEEITYTVTEDAVTDYTSKVDGFDVTNTHAPGKTSITVTKAWDDKNNQDGKRPDSVTVHLLADGEDTGKSLVLNKDNKWTASFEELDEKKAGKDIAYTVQEEAVTGYTTVITGDAKKGYIITNTHIPETTSVSGSKTWVDNNNEDGIRPGSITINLMAGDKKIESKKVTADEDGKWTWTFDNLPMYESGRVIRYAITEERVAGYDSEVKGFDITNTHTPSKSKSKISIYVKKVWNDARNKDRIRPTSVVVHLLADGKDTGKTVTLHADNGWGTSFRDLDAYEEEKAIQYSVVEEAVSGYTAKVTGNSVKGFTITNTHIPAGHPGTPKTPAKPTQKVTFSAPKTGDSSGIILYGAAFIAAFAALLFLLIKRKRKENN